jgi:hypothetical protein
MSAAEGRISRWPTVEPCCFLSARTYGRQKHHPGDAIGMSTSVFGDDNRPEGHSDQRHPVQAEVRTHRFEVTGEIPGTQVRGVLRELGAATTPLIVEDDDVAFRERLYIGTDAVYACTRTTMNDDNGIVAGPDDLVEDLGASRTGHIALCRWCCLMPTTNRRRDENAEEEHSNIIRRCAAV